MAIKKCVAVQLGVIYDSQATNRKQGGLPVRAPSPTALLLAARESNMLKYTKNNHKQVEALTF
jgi:hypothetical protein